MKHLNVIEIAGRRWFIEHTLKFPTTAKGEQSHIVVNHTRRVIFVWERMLPRDRELYIAHAICELWRLSEPGSAAAAPGPGPGPG